MAQSSFPFNGEGVPTAGDLCVPPRRNAVSSLLCCCAASRARQLKYCRAGDGGLPNVPSRPHASAPRRAPSQGCPGAPRCPPAPSPRPMAARGSHPRAGPSGSQGSWVGGNMPRAVCLLPTSCQRCVDGGVAARGPCGQGQGGRLAGSRTVPPCHPQFAVAAGCPQLPSCGVTG